MASVTSQQTTSDQISSGLAGALISTKQGYNADDISKASGEIARDVSGNLAADPDFRRLVDKPANLRMINNIKVDSQQSVWDSVKVALESFRKRITPDEEKTQTGSEAVIKGIQDTNSILNQLLRRPSRASEATEQFDDRIKKLQDISNVIGKNVGDLLLAKEIAKYANQAVKFKENYRSLLNIGDSEAAQVREMRVHFAGLGEDITGTGKLFSQEYDVVNKSILETSGYLGASFGDVNAIMNTLLSGGNLIGRNQKDLVSIVKVSREMAALFGMSDEEAAGLASNMLTMGKSTNDIKNLSKAVLNFGKSLGLASNQMGDVLKNTEKWATLRGRFGNPSEMKKVSEGFSKVTALSKAMNLDVSQQSELVMKSLTDPLNAATQQLYQIIGRGNTELGAKLAANDPSELMGARLQAGIARISGFVSGDMNRLFNLTETQRTVLLENIKNDLQGFSAEESGSMLTQLQRFLSSRKDLMGASAEVIRKELIKYHLESSKLPANVEAYQKSLEAFRGTIEDIFEDIGKAFDSLKVTIGQPILQAVLPTLEGLRDIFRSIGRFAQENAEILRTVGKAVMAFAMISFFRIDKLLSLTRTYKELGGAIKGISGSVPIIGKFTAFISAAGARLAILGTAAFSFLSRIPIIGGVIQKVFGPIIFLINSKLVKALLKFSVVFANVLGGMQLALINFSKVLFSFQLLNPAFWLAWSAVAVGALMYYTGFLDTLYQVFRDNANVIREAFWDPIVGVWGEIKSIIRSIYIEIVSFFSDLGSVGEKSGLTSIFEDINLSVSKVLAAFAILSASMAGGLIGGILKGIKAILLFTKAGIMGILYIASSIREFFTGAKGYSDAYFSLFSTSLEKAKQALIDFVKTILTGPLVALKKVVAFIFGAESTKFIDEWIGNINGAVDTAFSKIGSVVSWLKDKLSFLSPYVKMVFGGVKTAFQYVMGIIDEAKKKFASVTSVFDTIRTTIFESFGSIGAGGEVINFQTIITKKFNIRKLATAIGEVGVIIFEALSTPFRDFINYIGGLFGYSNLGAEIQQGFSVVVKRILDMLTGIFTGFLDLPKLLNLDPLGLGKYLYSIFQMVFSNIYNMAKGGLISLEGLIGFEPGAIQNQLWKFLVDTGNKIRDKFQSYGSFAAQWFGLDWEGLKASTKIAFSNLKSLIFGFVSPITGNLVSTVRSGLEKAWEYIKGIFSIDTGLSIKEMFANINWKEGFVKLIEDFKSIDWKAGFTNLVERFKSIDWKVGFTNLVERFKSIDWKAGFESLVERFKSMDWMKAFQYIAEGVKNAFNNLKSYLSDSGFWNWIIVSFSLILPMMLSLFEKAKSALLGMLSGRGGASSGGLIKSITKVFSSAFALIKKLYIGFGNWLVTGGFQVIAGFFSGMWASIKTMASGFFPWLRSAFFAFGKWLVTNAPIVLKAAGTGMLQAIRLFFTSTWGLISRFLPAVTGAIAVALGSVGAAIRSFFVLSNPYLWIAVAVGSLLYYLGFFDKLWDEIQKYNWKEIFQPLMDVFSGKGADKGFLASMADAFRDIGKALAPLMPILAKIVVWLALVFSYALAPVLVGTVKLLVGLSKLILGFLGALVAGIVNIAASVGTLFYSAGKGISKFFEVLDKGGGLGEAFSAAWDTFVSTFTDTWRDFEKWFGPFIEKSLKWLVESGPDILTGLWEIVYGIGDALLKGTFKAIGWDYDAFILKVSEWIEAIANWTSSIVNFFSSWEGFKSGLASVGDYIWEKLKAAGTWIADSISNAILKAAPNMFLSEEQQKRKTELLKQERIDELAPAMQKAGLSKDSQATIVNMMEKTGSRDYEDVVKALPKLGGRSNQDQIIKAMAQAGNTISDVPTMIGMIKDWTDYAYKIGLSDTLTKVGITYLIQKGESSYKNGIRSMDQIKRVSDLNKGVGADANQVAIAAVRNLQEGGFWLDSNIVKGLTSLKEGKSFDENIKWWAQSPEMLKAKNEAAMSLLSSTTSGLTLPPTVTPTSAGPVLADKIKQVNAITPQRIDISGQAVAQAATPPVMAPINITPPVVTPVMAPINITPPVVTPVVTPISITPPVVTPVVTPISITPPVVTPVMMAPVTDTTAKITITPERSTIPADKMNIINEVMPELINLAGTPTVSSGKTVAELDQGTLNAINGIANSIKADSAQRAEFIKLVKIKWLGQKAYGSGEVDDLVRMGAT